MYGCNTNKCSVPPLHTLPAALNTKQPALYHQAPAMQRPAVHHQGPAIHHQGPAIHHQKHAMQLDLSVLPHLSPEQQSALKNIIQASAANRVPTDGSISPTMVQGSGQRPAATVTTSAAAGIVRPAVAAAATAVGAALPRKRPAEKKQQLGALDAATQHADKKRVTAAAAPAAGGPMAVPQTLATVRPAAPPVPGAVTAVAAMVATLATVRPAAPPAPSTVRPAAPSALSTVAAGGSGSSGKKLKQATLPFARLPLAAAQKTITALTAAAVSVSPEGDECQPVGRAAAGVALPVATASRLAVDDDVIMIEG